MAKSDTNTCPYCSAKVEVKAGSLRPHLRGNKDGADRCDGSGLDVSHLTVPSGEDEGRTETGAKGDKS